MSQICSFCGCPLEEGCGVCPNCGSPVSGGDALDTPLYSDPTLESVSGEEFSAVPAPEPVSEPTAVPKSEPRTTPKAVSVPKASDYDHIISTPAKTSATPAAASTTYSPPTPKPKKKRSCCGCGCCLPVLIALALSVFLIFSGIAGEIFAGLGIPVDLSGIEALLRELAGELPSAEHGPEGDIPADAVEFNGHYYYIYTDPVASYDEAWAFCTEKGGYLATITSDGENQFLYDHMVSLGYTYVYLGGTDAAEEGVWVWSNGEPFDYTRWNVGEPNDDNGGEDALGIYEMLTDGSWNDLLFTSPYSEVIYPEIAQIEASSVLKGKDKYSAGTLIDGELGTAWNEGADGITGESVTQYFSGEYQLTGLEIWGGFQYSSDDYYSNARPALIQLTFSDGTVQEYALEDVQDVQSITFDAPVTAEWVTLTVTDSYAGSYYDDLCISELYYQAGTVPVCGFLCEWGEVTPAE